MVEMGKVVLKFRLARVLERLCYEACEDNGV
jgi:hypothetical protein